MDEGEAVLVDELTAAQERIAELERTLIAKARLVLEAVGQLEQLQPGVERLERENATLRKALAALVELDIERRLADEATEVPDTWTLPLSVSGTASAHLLRLLAEARDALEAADGKENGA